MSEKATPLNDNEKTKEKFDQFLRVKKNGLKGALIGGATGGIGGALVGHRWGRKNREEAKKASESYKNSLSDEQKKLKSKIDKRAKDLRIESWEASSKGTPQHLIDLIQAKEKRKLNDNKVKYKGTLTKEQKGHKRNQDSNEMKDYAKRNLLGLGGMLAGAALGNKIGEATTKKYSAEDRNEEVRNLFLNSISLNK